MYRVRRSAGENAIMGKLKRKKKSKCSWTLLWTSQTFPKMTVYLVADHRIESFYPFSLAKGTCLIIHGKVEEVNLNFLRIRIDTWILISRKNKKNCSSSVLLNMNFYVAIVWETLQKLRLEYFIGKSETMMERVS